MTWRAKKALRDVTDSAEGELQGVSKNVDRTLLGDSPEEVITLRKQLQDATAVVAGLREVGASMDSVHVGLKNHGLHKLVGELGDAMAEARAKNDLTSLHHLEQAWLYCRRQEGRPVNRRPATSSFSSAPSAEQIGSRAQDEATLEPPKDDEPAVPVSETAPEPEPRTTRERHVFVAPPPPPAEESVHETSMTEGQEEEQPAQPATPDSATDVEDDQQVIHPIPIGPGEAWTMPLHTDHAPESDAEKTGEMPAIQDEVPPPSEEEKPSLIRPGGMFHGYERS